MSKSLSYLIEAALEKEAVLMASAAVTEKLERISKELAKMIADDVIPLGDSMRDLFGADQATSFENMVSEKINSLLEQVRTARNEISDQIDALKNGEQMTDIAKAGDGEDMFADDPNAQPAPAPEGEAAVPAEGDDPFGMEDDQGDDDSAFGGQAADPGFGAGDDMGNAAGRPQKESYRSAKKVLEGASADHRLTKQFAGLIREGKSASYAVRAIAESYALDVATVVDIITEVKKG